MDYVPRKGDGFVSCNKTRKMGVREGKYFERFNKSAWKLVRSFVLWWMVKCEWNNRKSFSICGRSRAVSCSVSKIKLKKKIVKIVDCREMSGKFNWNLFFSIFFTSSSVRAHHTEFNEISIFPSSKWIIILFFFVLLFFHFICQWTKRRFKWKKIVFISFSLLIQFRWKLKWK